MDLKKIDRLLHRSEDLTQHIIRRLDAPDSHQAIFNLEKVDWQTLSAVLFLLGRYSGSGPYSDQPCLILNKRSARVRQPGDLCCPGGRISPRLDAGLSALLRLPMSPLARWPHWQQWQREQPQQARWLRLLLATGMRESVEEMRLNPFGLTFLGPLPAQSLNMFNRVIYPMVAWVSGQKRFYPNWEVAKIVFIPLRDLCDPANYARYCLQIQNSAAGDILNTFPCFRYQEAGETEILWGATYQITVGFLKRIFDFEPPDMHSLPEIHGRLGRSYLSRAS
ncbi:MAG: CoA pyrophosphatase [Desulfobacterales bacterium]|jgi:hypothetical protein